MRIAVLEDEPDQSAHLVRTLEQMFTQGDALAVCSAFADGAEMQRVLRRESFDLLVLDWNVPGLDGAQLVEWLRVWQKNPVPVLILSSRGSEHDVAKALNAGADDYIIKPFRPVELRARVQRLITRRNPSAAEARQRFGRWEFERASLSMLVHADPPDLAPPQQYKLTDREFRLALALFENLGCVVSRAHLLESAGYSGEELSSRTLDSHIYRLRNKLGLSPEHGLSLHAVYGRGYCLEAAQPPLPA
jgi:DNA-binding response OmpR family regulator